MGTAMIVAMLGIVTTWLLLFLSFCGIGLTFQKLLGMKALDGENNLSAFWFGWCLVLMGLQIWHWFAPVDWRPLFFVFVLGAGGIYLSRNQLASLCERENFGLPWIFTLCLVIVWLANQALAPVRTYDAGLYHLSAIRWISSYPIIPGLANLHDRLGFNSSYFLFQAMLDVGFWTNRSHHLASGLLLLAVLLEIGFSVYKIITKRPIYIYDLMRILLLAPILNQCFSQASTTSPDLAMYLVGVLISVRLCKLLFSESPSQTEALDVALIIILSAIGVTIKLSFLAMGFLASLVAVGTSIYRVAKQGDEIVRLTKLIVPAVLVLLILLPWMARNVILSGYPVYPVAILPFDVEWKVTPESLTNLNGWIQGWARNPHALPRDVLANWDWLQGWTTEILRHHKFDVTFPLLLFLIGSLIRLSAASNAVLPLSRYAFFFLPPLGMIVFWFLTAPEPRYAGAVFWYLGAGAISLACGELFYDPITEQNLVHCRFFPRRGRGKITAHVDDYTARS